MPLGGKTEWATRKLIGSRPILFTYYDFNFKVTERAKNNFCLLKK